MTRRRWTFTIKLAAVTWPIAVADMALFGQWTVPAGGVFALCWTAAVLVAVPRMRRGAAAIAAGAALLFGMVLIEDPSLLAWVSFWTAVSLAALLPHRRFDDAARWAVRLGLHGVRGIGAPFRDIAIVARIGRGGNMTAAPGIRAAAKVVALPLAGSALFLGLFASANPLIGDALRPVKLPDAVRVVQHAALWVGVALAVWPSLRPSRVAARLAVDARPMPRVAEVPPATLMLSLACFNAVFALQNGLDIAFLWSGAALPASVTLADYAHRGAYTLIATALLAALFVLLALRPGSAGARSPLVRRLLVLWVAQNVLLVASSVLRLIDYIQAYALTEWRIAALAWMGLVGIGLVLICWRLLSARSAAWLLNANVAAVALMLSAASVVDLGATAAAWNVRHARTADDLDLCYLNGLGASALLPLVALERRVRGTALRERVAYVRNEALRDALSRQGHALTVSWRNTRRIDAAMALLGPAPVQPRATAHGRACDGSILPPPPPASDPQTNTQTLTAAGER